MSATDRLITLDRLQSLLDAYGAEPDRWPAEQRAGAVALIESSDEARAMFEDAAGMDRLLDRMAEPAVSPAFVRRMRRMQMPSRGRRLSGMLTAVGEWLQPGSRFAWQGAVAAAAVLGIVGGIGFSELVLDHREVTPVEAESAEPPAPVIMISGIEGSGSATSSLTLEQDVRALSLTGTDGTITGTAYTGDDSETSLASIPLY